jgi:hypothetical protein
MPVSEPRHGDSLIQKHQQVQPCQFPSRFV